MSWNVVKFIVFCLVLALTVGQMGMAGTTGTVEEEAAKEKSSLVRTFHIGNSLTDTVDGWLAPVAESAGRKLDFHRFTIPGADGLAVESSWFGLRRQQIQRGVRGTGSD